MTKKGAILTPEQLERKRESARRYAAEHREEITARRKARCRTDSPSRMVVYRVEGEGIPAQEVVGIASVAKLLGVSYRATYALMLRLRKGEKRVYKGKLKIDVVRRATQEERNAHDRLYTVPRFTALDCYDDDGGAWRVRTIDEAAKVLGISRSNALHCHLHPSEEASHRIYDVFDPVGDQPDNSKRRVMFEITLEQRDWTPEELEAKRLALEADKEARRLHRIAWKKNYYQTHKQEYRERKRRCAFRARAAARLQKSGSSIEDEATNIQGGIPMPKTTTKKSPSPVKAAIAKTPTPTQPTLQAKPKVKRPRHNWKNPEEQKAWKKDYNRRYYQNHKPVKATAVPTKVVAMPAAKKPEPTYLELLSRVEKDMSRLTKSLELVRKARAAVPPPMELKSTGKGRPARLYRVVSPSGEAQTLLGMTSVVKTIGISHSTVERAKRQASKAGWQLEVVKQAQARG